MVGRRILDLGLANSVRAFDHPCRYHVIQFGLASLRRRCSRSSWTRTRSRRRRSSKSSRNSPGRSSSPHCCGCRSRRHSTSPRVCIRVHGRYAAYVAKLHPHRSDGGGVRLVCHHPARRPHLRPHRTQEDVPDRRGRHGPVRVSLFRHGGYGHPVGGVHRHRAVADPARYPVRAASGAHRRRSSRRGYATAAPRSAISSRRSSPAARRRSSRPPCSPRIAPATRLPSTSPRAPPSAWWRPLLCPITPGRIFRRSTTPDVRRPRWRARSQCEITELP